VFLGPPGTGKSHLSIALGIRACLVGHRVAFATAAEWVDRCKQPMTPASCKTNFVAWGDTRSSSSMRSDTSRFQGEAANLFFQLVSSRYERASVIVNSQQGLQPMG